ncbi:MAG: 3-oxoacyl-[acyl-carrier-protein] reductase [Deltaproteobacteria bacterium]|jgi:3-oxoacyl-[acyl-carrier protein] reductase|nr:3-oxoacyl-[acyl-carrier-protein] reductase [Deltaproteobacteria bacterium]
MDNSQRVVVVTGGSRGIGRAIALKFAEEHPVIIIMHYDQDESFSDQTLAMLREKDIRCESFKVDVSSKSAVESFFENVLEKYGRVDTLINNAGITRDSLLMKMTERDWDLVLNINLKSIFNCTQTIIRSMIKNRRGTIVNIASVSGQMGVAGQANYSASKAGIMGFTKAVAREVASRGITVNAVAPGFIQTEMTDALSEKVVESYLQQIPLRRLGTVQDVSETVYWLCSEAASYITGQIIHVNGGLYM